MPTIAQLKVFVGADISNLEAGLRRGEKAVDDFARGARESGERAARGLSAALGMVDVDRLRSAGQALTVGVTAPLLAAGAASVKMASDVAESQSKVRAVFGASAASIEKWAESANAALGQSRQEALEAAGTLGNLFTSMGIGQGQAAEMSKRLVQLSTDLGSFNNVAAGDAMVALRAGLVGESEPLRRFGVNLNEAALQAEALRIGLIKSTKEGLDPAAKAQAAYSLIFQQSKNAQGDFVRTGDGFAATLKKLEASTKDEAAALGKELLPAAKDLLKTGADLLKLFNSLPDGVKQFGIQAAITGAALGPLAQGVAGLLSAGKTLGLIGGGAAGAAAGALGTATVVEGGAKAGLLARAGGLLAAPVGIAGAAAAGVTGGVGLAYGLNALADARNGKADVGIGGTLYGLGLNAGWSGAKAKGPQSLDELRKANGGMTPREMILAQQRAAAAEMGRGAKAIFNDPEDLLKARDATFAAEKARAGVLLATGDEETKAAREAAAMVPILKRQREDLLKRAQELKPQVGEDAKRQVEYQNLLADIAQVDEESARLQAAAVKERKERQKKALSLAQDLREATFAGRRQAIEAGLAGAPEDRKAQMTAGAMSGLLAGRQRELVAEAQSLQAQARTDPEAQKRLLEVHREWWDLQAESNQLRAAATKEQVANAKKARTEEDKLFEAEIAADEQAINARLALVEDGQKAQATAAAKLPLLERVRQDLIAGLEDLRPGSEEFVKQEGEIWKLEERQADLLMAAAKEGKEGQRKATEKARKAAADQAEVLELKTKLMSAQIENNPLLNGRQKQNLMLGAQLQQYRQAMMAVEGETEKERLQRLISAEGIKGDLWKTLGGFKRTLGGGVAFNGDRRALMAVNREMLAIEAQSLRPTPAPNRPTAPAVPRPAGVKQFIFHIAPGMSVQQQLEMIRRQLVQEDDQYYALPGGE